MRSLPRPATFRARRTEKSRDRNPPTKQGRRSRRDTNELRASSAQLRANLFKDSSTRLFFKSLTTLAVVPRCGQAMSDSRADFFRMERFASLKRYSGQ